MLLSFLRRYLLSFIISLSCLGALIYYTIVSPEDFDPVFTLYLSYAILLAANIGIGYHAYTWVQRVKNKK